MPVFKSSAQNLKLAALFGFKIEKMNLSTPIDELYCEIERPCGNLGVYPMECNFILDTSQVRIDKVKTQEILLEKENMCSD